MEICITNIDQPLTRSSPCTRLSSRIESEEASKQFGLKVNSAFRLTVKKRPKTKWNVKTFSFAATF